MNYQRKYARVMQELQNSTRPEEAEGLYINIIERKCSDKIQPDIIEHDTYKILEVLPNTRGGAMCLKVKKRNNVLGDDPKAGKVYQINSNRFEWCCYRIDEVEKLEGLIVDSVMESNKSQERSQEIEQYLSYEQAKAELERRMKEEDKSTALLLRENFTDKELYQISFCHMELAELVWRYAVACLDTSANYKIECTKKLCRKIREVRTNWLKGNIGNSVDVKLSSSVERNSDEFGYQKDFQKESKFAWKVISDQYEKQFPNEEIPYLDLRIIAQLGMIMIKVYNHQIDKANAMIDERIGNAKNLNSMRNPIISDTLRSFFDAMIGDFELENCKQLETVKNAWIKIVGETEVGFNEAINNTNF